MAKRRKDKDTRTVESCDGDVTTTPEGHKILGINWYIREAKVAMEQRDWNTAWYHLGSALQRCTDTAEEWDLKQLQKKCYRLLLNRKTDKKKDKDKDKRRKRREDI